MIQHQPGQGALETPPRVLDAYIPEPAAVVVWMVPAVLFLGSVGEALGRQVVGFGVGGAPLLRPRPYLGYPAGLLDVVSLDPADEAEDLEGHDTPEVDCGVVYWARQDDAGATEILPGDSEELRITAQVAADLPAGTPIPLRAVVRSQRTLAYQNVDGEAMMSVSGGVAPVCADGVYTVDEDDVLCPDDCPLSVGDDGVTSFDFPPCCPGLTRIRASHPYSWAYEQCYDWTCETDEDRASCPADW